MKTNTEPTAIENLKYEIGQKTYLYGPHDIEMVNIRKDTLIRVINQALSEAERKAWEAGELHFRESYGRRLTAAGGPTYRDLEDWQKKHGAKI